jgi:hypothetical protein
MGKLLRLASTETKRIQLDDEDWVEVKADIDKRTFAKLVSILPGEIGNDEASNMTVAQAMEFQKNLFEVFVTDWSLVDAKGKAVPAEVENYLSLSREAAEAVDTAISEHFNALTPSQDEQSKSA